MLPLRMPIALWLLAALAMAMMTVAPTAWAQPANPVEIVGPSATPLQIEAQKGQLLRLPRAAQSVFVADPEVADVQVKSPTLIYVFGKKAGETTLYAVDAREAVLLNARVVVTHNLSRLRTAIAQLNLDTEIDLDSIDNAIVLNGNVASAGHAEDIRRLAARFAPGEGGVINRLRVDAPSQVNLRVRVAEVSRRVIKQFGFNWESLFSSGGFLLGLATGNPVVSGGSFLTRRSNNNNVFGGVRQGRLNLNVLVDALANEGLLTVLAEPNLTALSGETASFLAGGEFPIPVPQGNNVVTIEFKRFGVSLGFTPTLIDGDRINLRVNPEVSELTSNGSITINNFVIPALTTRRAETTVELGSGQSFAIAGLLKSDLDHDIKKLPGLGDLPVLGTLFRSDTFKRGETELVIIVTPYVVRPVSSARALHAPTDGLIPPNDAERILLGRNYSEQSGKQRTGNPISPGRRLIGPVGFILE